jgi:hypothetical protein
MYLRVCKAVYLHLKLQDASRRGQFGLLSEEDDFKVKVGARTQNQSGTTQTRMLPQYAG